MPDSDVTGQDRRVTATIEGTTIVLAAATNRNRGCVFVCVCALRAVIEGWSKAHDGIVIVELRMGRRL